MAVILYRCFMERSTGACLSTGKKLLFAMMLVAVVFALLEGAAQLLLRSGGDRHEPTPDAGWQTAFFRSSFDWHEPDPDLLWRFRPNLNNSLIKTNSRGLIADEIPPGKHPDALRVLVLGDSSPVGLGLRDRSAAFPEVLKRQLGTFLAPGQTAEVINAAVSGYSSEQIALFLDTEGILLEPDFVVLYCGNNDASISGSRSDRELLQAQKLPGLRHALNRSAFYRMLRDVLASTTTESSWRSGTALVPRVTPARYAENLERIAKECTSHGARLFVVVPPVPRLWPASLQFRPLRHVIDDAGELIFPQPLRAILDRELFYCLSEAHLNLRYEKIDPFTRLVYRSAVSDTLSPDLAADRWRSIAAADPRPVNCNNLGVSLWRVGDFHGADSAFDAARRALAAGAPGGYARHAEGAAILYNRGINALDAVHADDASIDGSSALAVACLDSALQDDWLSLRIKRPYVEAILALTGRPGVTVVDPGAHFRAAGFERLFVDHCHPTELGHQIIGRALAEAMFPFVPEAWKRLSDPA